MIGIIDYGMGNLRSVQKALEALGYEAFISSDKEELSRAKGLILPGVGAFPDAMKNLKSSGLDLLVKEYAEENKPVLGICLGMQLLFDVSYEVCECKGLGLINGRVLKLDESLKIPHMGWNDLALAENCPLLEGVEEGNFVYFVHSYYVEMGNGKDLNAYTNYGVKVPAIVSRGNVFGAQFHPEKSGSTGMQILKNFGELVKCLLRE
jgi:glutamine amidotransferase